MSRDEILEMVREVISKELTIEIHTSSAYQMYGEVVYQDIKSIKLVLNGEVISEEWL